MGLVTSKVDRIPAVSVRTFLVSCAFHVPQGGRHDQMHLIDFETDKRYVRPNDDRQFETTTDVDQCHYKVRGHSVNHTSK
jgi:hypothetical protein